MILPQEHATGLALHKQGAGAVAAGTSQRSATSKTLTKTP